MSHRDKFFKRLRGLLYCVLMIVCYALMFVFVDNDFLACMFLVLSITFMTMFLMSFVNKAKRNPKMSLVVKKTIYNNPISLDEVKKMYHLKGLDKVEDNILKVFFNEDNTKRFVIYQESNSVKARLEYLEYFADDTKAWMFEFAQWYTVDLARNSIYADVKIAINDNKDLLKDFHEEEFPKVKRQQLNTEIVWKGITLESSLIPFGSYNKFDIQIKDKIIKDVAIHNSYWYNLINSDATIYVNEQETLPCKRFRFKILHDNKIIGYGIKKYKE